MKIINHYIAQQYSEMRHRLRKCLHSQGFCEIISPVWRISQPECTSNCFTYELRDSMELYLRSAMASGLDAIYEMGPCFRLDDPSDEVHLPEFNVLEIFKRDLDYFGLIKLTQDLLETAFSSKIESFDEVNVMNEFENKFPNLNFNVEDSEILSQITDITDCDVSFASEAVDYLVNNVIITGNLGTLERPLILTHFPRCTISLAKPWEEKPYTIQRFEVLVHGVEIAHGFVDDNDHQSVKRRMHQNNPKYLDENFLRLLQSHTLPNSSAGVGFGLERLAKVANGIHDIKSLTHCFQYQSE